MSTAIVTGASQGFGLALATALAEQGTDVVVDARDAGMLRAAVAATANPDRIHAIPGDVSDTDHQQALVEAARRLGGLDLLVHNASELGPSPMPALADWPPQPLARLYRVNVLAPLELTQKALPLLREAPDPVIVTLSSDAAVEPYAGWGGYGSSKAALDHVAAILGQEEPTIRVYAFDPGDMRTQMHQRAFPGEDISDRPEPHTVVAHLLTLLSARLPSGRYRAADIDVASAA